MYLLKMNVVQVIGAANRLHHPVVRGDHVQCEERGLGHLSEACHWPWGHRIIGLEGHVRLQHIAVEAGMESRGKTQVPLYIRWFNPVVTA